MLLSEISKFLSIEYTGDDCEIVSLNTLQDANSTQLSFLDNPKYAKILETTKAAAVLVHPEHVDLVPKHTVALVTAEPYLKLAYLTKLFAPALLEEDGATVNLGKNSVISPNVYLGKNVTIGENSTIMPNAFIGDNVTIGNHTVIHPNVTIYRDCVIGSNCFIHASSVIGSDGFGFAHTKTGEHIKIYQNGNVVIEDDVEIGSNTSVDRAVFGSTRIQKGCKIDNLIQIGHNVVLEEGVIVVAHSAIAGSSTIGHHSVLAGQTGVVGHVKVAPFTTVASRGAIASDIKESGLTWAGFPHMLQRDWLKMNAKTRALLKKNNAKETK